MFCKISKVVIRLNDDWLGLVDATAGLRGECSFEEIQCFMSLSLARLDLGDSVTSNELRGMTVGLVEKVTFFVDG